MLQHWTVHLDCMASACWQVTPGTSWDFQNFSSLVFISYFIMLNFVAFRKGIDTSLGTNSGILLWKNTCKILQYYKCYCASKSYQRRQLLTNSKVSLFSFLQSHYRPPLLVWRHLWNFIVWVLETGFPI